MIRLPRTSKKLRRTVFCAAIAALLPTAFAGHGSGARPETVVGVQPGRYVVAGQSYAGVDALHAAVRAAQPGAVLIVSCSPAATASWLAAVKQLDDLPMHLDVSDGASPACASAKPASVRPGSAAPDVDPAVQRYWSARQP